jgi:hypothetical protein
MSENASGDRVSFFLQVYGHKGEERGVTSQATESRKPPTDDKTTNGRQNHQRTTKTNNERQNHQRTTA